LEFSGHEQALADLERIYGDHSPSSPSVEPLTSQASGATKECALDSAVALPPVASPPPSASSAGGWPPVDTKRDLTPCALLVGPHGLLCLQPIEETRPPQQKR
jgi:hypothetical protein